MTDADREVERRCHARGGIPLYLLTDRDKAQVTLFGEPEDDGHRRHRAISFGKEFALPEPFGFGLATSDFVRAGPSGG